MIGTVEKVTGSFEGGLVFLGVSAAASGGIILALGLGRRTVEDTPRDAPIPAPEPSTR